MAIRLRNVYVLVILIIGVSSPLGALIKRDRGLTPFRTLSPLPLLFSIESGRKLKINGEKILLETKSGTHLFKFDREFYRNLGGPHHHKVLFTLNLTWTKFLTHASAANFMQKTFCQNFFKLENLNGEKIEAVKIMTAKDDVILDWQCQP